MDLVVTYGATTKIREAMARLTLVAWEAEKAAGRIDRFCVQNVSGRPAPDLQALVPSAEWVWLPRADSQRTRSIHAEQWARTPFYILSDDDVCLDPQLYGHQYRATPWSTYIPAVMERLALVQSAPYTQPSTWPPQPHPALWIGDKECITGLAIGICRFIRRGCGMDETLGPATPGLQDYDAIRNARFALYGRQGHLTRVRGLHLGCWGRSEIQWGHRGERRPTTTRTQTPDADGDPTRASTGVAAGDPESAPPTTPRS